MSKFVVGMQVQHNRWIKSYLIVTQADSGLGNLVIGDKRHLGLPGSDNRIRSDTGRVKHGLSCKKLKAGKCCIRTEICQILVSPDFKQGTDWQTSCRYGWSGGAAQVKWWEVEQHQWQTGSCDTAKAVLSHPHISKFTCWLVLKELQVQQGAKGRCH